MSDYTPYDAYTMRECIERQDATIARLEAENAALREEAALYQKEWAILRAEVEQLKKELRILYSSNTDIFARAEQAENAVKSLPILRNLCFQEQSRQRRRWRRSKWHLTSSVGGK